MWQHLRDLLRALTPMPLSERCPPPEIVQPNYASPFIGFDIRPREQRLFEIANGSIVDIGPWPPRDVYAWIDPWEGR